MCLAWFQNNEESAGYDKDAKYEFMYRVQGDGKPRDSHEHDVKSEPSDFGHSEAREGDRTWGRYFVKLPDGRVQTVKYWADHSGYHAEVLFQGEAKHPEDLPATPPKADSFPRHSYKPLPSYPSVREVDEPYKQQLPVSYAQVQDAPVAYAHAQEAPVAFAHTQIDAGTFAHAQEGPYAHAPSHDDSFDEAPAHLGPSQKPFYSSQPTFVAPPHYFLGSASEGVKVVQKPPTTTTTTPSPKKSERRFLWACVQNWMNGTMRACCSEWLKRARFVDHVNLLLFTRAFRWEIKVIKTTLSYLFFVIRKVLFNKLEFLLC